jgi:hypothetical protein
MNVEIDIALNTFEEQTNKPVNTQFQAENRFQSVTSNDPTPTKTDNQTNIMDSLNIWMDKAYSKTKEIAINVKDKVDEMDLGTKLKNAGIKTMEVVKETSNKVVEKSTEAAVLYY